MVRSMLAHDPVVLDLGQFRDRPEEHGPTQYLVDVVRRAQENNPGRLVVVNPKMSRLRDLDRYAADIRELGAPVLVLLRRDKLARLASETLAREYKSWFTAPPRGASVRITGRDLLRMDQTAERQAHALSLLSDVRHIVLHYEDISVSTLRESLTVLGLDLQIGEPATRKTTPARLEEFVTNIGDLR